MAVPDYFLPEPPFAPDDADIAEFERMFDQAVNSEGPLLIDYRCRAPKWQFLTYLSDRHEVLLHGSTNPGIEIFEPRPCQDVNAFGAQRAVYAASDGIWPMYFAILDRATYPMTLMNSAARLLDDACEPTRPYYFFSISDSALRKKPWKSGCVYILPRAGFVRDPIASHQGRKIVVSQWASLDPVKPIGKLLIEPEDFPFLDRMRGHDDEVVWKRAADDPDGFPWLDPI